MAIFVIHKIAILHFTDTNNKLGGFEMKEQLPIAEQLKQKYHNTEEVNNF